MNITFTLTEATSGTTAAGPFNISGTTNANVVSSLATGVTKIQLTTGYTINGVNDAITGGTIASTGTCTNTIPWTTVDPEPTIYTYNCTNGTCIQVEGIGGTFSNLEDCEADCSANPPRYDCTDQGCVEAVDGDYATLEDCNAAPCVQGPSPS
jgi:hypothetical protein